MEKTNKEVIDSLQEYFLKQNPKIIARTLAALMIDVNRMININSLPKDEAAILIARMHSNRNQLLKFIKDGPQGDLTLHNIES